MGGVDKDYYKAMKWYLKAAAQGTCLESMSFKDGLGFGSMHS